MSLVELIISAGIFSFVVAGTISSTMMFAKIATDHENRADFTDDMRNGMETMSFDVRNANRVTAISDTSFSLSLSSGSTVSYVYDNVGVITRTESGQSRKVFSNVSEFDLLTGIADEPADNSLSYSNDKISIETLSFSAGRGSSGSTTFNITNFTLNMRNR